MSSREKFFIYSSILYRVQATLIIFFFFSIHKATTTVYQVTRPGHEHCDVTEGVLLDITPLDVDGKKLVTLYDKDLTEGVNLLIGKKQRNSAREAA